MYNNNLYLNMSMKLSNNNKNSININNLGKIVNSLKLAIQSKINKSFKSTFKNMATNEIKNWKNRIIELINKEIDKFEFKLPQIINDLNQKEFIISEEQKGQKSAWKNQNENSKKSSLNPNNESPVDKSDHYNDKNINEKKPENYHYNNKNNNNKIIIKNKPLSGSKIHQSKYQNMSQNVQTNNSKLSKKIKIRLDFFSSKDIQEENIEIIKKFKNETQTFIDVKEEVKNENIANFLIQVASVSRKAYNISNELFINMFKKFSKFIEEEKSISNLKYDEQLRKEFSSWVKQYEKEPEGKKQYENYFNSFKGAGKYSEEIYLSTLLSQLTILYFHCELSFPIVDIDFNSEQIFNDEKMIDLINKGNNRKVNFLILPSLLSNDNYLEYGKSFVFTYKRETFKFSKLRFENLVNKQEKYIDPQKRQANTDCKFYQSNSQNIEQNNQDNISKLSGKINIEQNKRLDFFTSKDIQEENKEITRIFQKESLNHINDDEETENEAIANFLIKVANVSRKAYNISNDLFINMFKEFSKFIEEKKTISNLKYDKQLKKEFSSWVKQYEKKTEGKKKYENYFNSFKGAGKYSEEIYLSTLLSQLTILYFHCELSFPIVDVDFDYSEIIFDHEKMIDFVNKGNNRKVDFIILPSLFSNGNYLENGKLWVFTYKKDTFKFGKSRFENLVNKQEKYSKNNFMNSQNNKRDIKNKINIPNNSNFNENPKERET